MKIRPEVWPFIGSAAAVSAGVAVGWQDIHWGGGLFFTASVGLLYFFRDPERTPPLDPEAILAGADGRVMSVRRQKETLHIQADCVRISIFLSLFDVHVNRAPFSGLATFLGHFPGRRLFAFLEKSFQQNQHNKILIQGERTRCLVVQIVGPVARRVVYWLSHETTVPVKAGDRIGMMKFGSRLDIYLPAAEVTVLVESGDRVRAGETVIARIKAVGSWSAKMNQKNTGEV